MNLGDNRESEDYIAKRFATYDACYAYAADYHGGQWSRAYALLGKLAAKSYRPGLSVREHGGDGLEPEARELYDRLVTRNY